MLDTNTFKKRLQGERDLVEKELSTVGRRNPQNSGDWEATATDGDRPAERDEVADKIESFEENTAIVRQLEARLAEITAALDRIEKGTYGKCSVCGNTIEEDRLEANPAAATCKSHMK